MDLDVAAPAPWDAACARILDRAGAAHILVNNAGINDRKTIIDATPEEWNRTLSVDLTGAFLGMKTMAPAIRRAGGGAIVNVCSLAAHVGGGGRRPVGPANGAFMRMVQGPGTRG